MSRHCVDHADCDEADTKADEEGAERPPHWQDRLDPKRIAALCDFAKPGPNGLVEIGFGYAVDLGSKSGSFGWMFRQGPEPKQWVTFRKAEPFEIEHARAFQAKPPCVTCAGTGMLDSGDVEIGVRPCDVCGGT